MGVTSPLANNEWDCDVGRLISRMVQSLARSAIGVRGGRTSSALPTPSRRPHINAVARTVAASSREKLHGRPSYSSHRGVVVWLRDGDFDSAASGVYLRRRTAR